MNENKRRDEQGEERQRGRRGSRRKSKGTKFAGTKSYKRTVVRARDEGFGEDFAIIS
jgi:hypothetical protein